MKAITFPQPTGKYAVGVAEGYFSYDGAEGLRKIGYRCFYPAKKALDICATYYKDRRMVEMLNVEQAPLCKALYSVSQHFDTLEIPAYPAAAIADERFPVIIYSHGYTGMASSNAIQMIELASYGYVVFGIAHPGESHCSIVGDEYIPLDVERHIRFEANNERYCKILGKGPDCTKWSAEELRGFLTFGLRKINILHWVEDTIRTIDEIFCLAETEGSLFAGHLETDSIGLFGHSYGGASSFATPFYDKRVASAVNIDGFQTGGHTIYAKLPVPGLYVTSNLSPVAIQANFGNQNDELCIVAIQGSTHLTLSDYSVVSGDRIREIDPKALQSIDGQTIARTLNDLTVNFFDKTLKNKTGTSIQETAKKYAHCVIYQTGSTSDTV